ncbi:hypothetical protein DYS86_24500 [Salmonella enterica]|nr:hypothetical protein [Salmonella enterica subsp. enterica serovar Johannesburg]EBO5060481.1 hypothetical protein [Salmonella enterica subsp. enterica serovar Johannesburg]
MKDESYLNNKLDMKSGDIINVEYAMENTKELPTPLFLPRRYPTYEKIAIANINATGNESGIVWPNVNI